MHFFSDLYMLNLAGGSTRHCIACRTRLRISKTRGIAMKRKGILALLIVLALGTGLTLLNRCSGGDMATVRIKFNHYYQTTSYSNRNWVDRILGFFSTKAFAGMTWSPNLGSLGLSVTGQGMSAILVSIPSGSSEFTIDVPSGSARTFTVTNTLADTGSNVPTNWKGKATIDLSPGSETALTINMIPVTRIWMITPSTGTADIYWATITGVPISGYRVYRSLNPDGPYTEIPNSPTESNSIGDSGLSAGTTYYYTISVFGSYGEGEMCEPYSVTM